MEKDFSEKLKELLKEINIEIDEKEVNDFYEYMTE